MELKMKYDKNKINQNILLAIFVVCAILLAVKLSSAASGTQILNTTDETKFYLLGQENFSGFAIPGANATTFNFSVKAGLTAPVGNYNFFVYDSMNQSDTVVILLLELTKGLIPNESTAGKCFYLNTSKGGANPIHNLSATAPNSNAPAFSWNVNVRHDCPVGNYTFFVYDHFNQSSTQNIEVSSTGNVPPTWDENLSDYTRRWTQELAVQINITDINGDTLTYTSNSSVINISSTGLMMHNYSFLDTGVNGIEICVDDGPNLPVCSAFNMTVTNDAPTIKLQQPGNNSKVFYRHLNTVFQVNDSENATLSCDLYLDGVFNMTVNDASNTSSTNFTDGGDSLAFERYNWSVNCTDGQATVLSETWFFNVSQTSNVSLVLCGNVTLFFFPNASLFNISSGTLTQGNAIANQTDTTGCTFNASNLNGGDKGLLWMNMSSDGTHIIKINGINLTTIPKNVINISVNSSTLFNASGHYVNATGPFNFTLDYSGNVSA